jgi:hypothetical protein
VSRSAAACLAVTLIAAASPVPPKDGGAPHPAVEPCSSYRPHVQAAHDDLVRGDRSKAIEDLGLARAALESCKRLHGASRDPLAEAR